MNKGGWIFMLFSVALVVALAGLCYWLVLTAPDEESEP